MKPSKAILIIAVIIVILLIIALIVNKSNKTKTANALMNQPATDANITGRFVAVSNTSTDFSELVNGKPKWLWAGRGNCSSDYDKITSGKNVGWCVLSASVNRVKKGDKDVIGGEVCEWDGSNWVNCKPLKKSTSNA